MDKQALLLYSRDYFISPLNSVTVEKRESQGIFPIHHHEFDELVIVSAGNGLHIWNEIPYPVTCGDMFYIDAKDRHGYQSVNNLKLDNILYRRELFSFLPAIEPYLPAANAPTSERYWQINTADLALLAPLINQLALESKKPDPLSIHLSEALFLQLVVTLYRFRRQPDGLSLTPAHQLDTLLTALHNSISTSFNLDDFCLQHHLAPRSLRRMFKAKTGMTIVGYLQQLRLCKAMALLRNPSYSISLIAADCGYDDSNYFSSVFHKKTGSTPSEYRKYFISNQSKGSLI